MAADRTASTAGISPTIAEYLNASNVAYSQPGISASFASSYPCALTPLQTVSDGQTQDVFRYDAADGFYAVALKTSENQVLIAYEGTNVSAGSAPFVAGQLADDEDIAAGRRAPSFVDARQFTRAVLADARADGIRPRDVFLTGHSLGAADCEYVAAKTGLGGATFGAPGISSRFFTRAAARLVDYVEVGDPVGNFAVENTGSFLLPSPMNDIVQSLAPSVRHYGTTHFIGQQNPTSLAAYASLRTADSLFKGGDAGKVLAAGALATAIPAHRLAEYASDLGVQLGSSDGSTGALITPLGAATNGGAPAAVARNAVIRNSTAQIVNATAPCFAGGTRIATLRGDVAVEDLAVGDLVATTSGAHRPIRWLGHRTIDCRRHPRPHEVRPIEIAAHAFGEGRPARDLRVSPGHSICVDVVGEVLIPAANLVNGATIRQVEVDEVTYWHVELDSHDILLAENLPAESYLDMGNRGFFAEAEVVDLAAGPDGDPALRTHADFCRPFHDTGALVEVVKAQLAARAESMGWSLTRALELHLEVDGRRVEPVVRGARVRFHVPAGAREVWLVAPTAQPRETMLTGDYRDLGLCLAALRIDDGVTVPRDVALDDPLLCVGFHVVEDGRRWTAGRALLPAALWEGCEDDFFLRLQLAAGPVPRMERSCPAAPGHAQPHLVV